MSYSDDYEDDRDDDGDVFAYQELVHDLDNEDDKVMMMICVI